MPAPVFTGAGHLRIGQDLTLPTASTNANDATTFKPCNPSEITGSTTPSLPTIAPPPPPSSHHCNALAMIIVIAVVVVATIFTAGAAAIALGAADAGIGAFAAGTAALSGGLGFTAAAAGAAFAGGFAGNVAGQLAGDALGVSHGLDLGSAFASGLTSVATAGIGSALSGTATFGAQSNAIVENGRTLNAAGKYVFGAAGYTSSQGINDAVGNHQTFSWQNLVASAVAAGSTAQLMGDGGRPGLFGQPNTGSFVQDLGSGVVSGVIKRGTEAALGSDRPDSWESLGENAVGNAIGNYAARTLNDFSQPFFDRYGSSESEPTTPVPGASNRQNQLPESYENRGDAPQSAAMARGASGQVPLGQAWGSGSARGSDLATGSGGIGQGGAEGSHFASDAGYVPSLPPSPSDPALDEPPTAVQYNFGNAYYVDDHNISRLASDGFSDAPLRYINGYMTTPTVFVPGHVVTVDSSIPAIINQNIDQTVTFDGPRMERHVPVYSLNVSSAYGKFPQVVNSETNHEVGTLRLASTYLDHTQEYIDQRAQDLVDGSQTKLGAAVASADYAITKAFSHLILGGAKMAVNLANMDNWEGYTLSAKNAILHPGDTAARVGSAWMNMSDEERAIAGIGILAGLGEGVPHMDGLTDVSVLGDVARSGMAAGKIAVESGVDLARAGARALFSKSQEVASAAEDWMSRVKFSPSGDGYGSLAARAQLGAVGDDLSGYRPGLPWQVEEGRVPNPAVSGGVRIATEQPAVEGQGTSDLLNQIREAGGTLPVVRGQVTVQDIAAASRAGGNEVAYFRDRATGQLYLRELGPQMGKIPTNSRLILHTQPGEGFLAVQPSSADRAALTLLNQRSSVIVNSEGTFAIRFRPLNTGDGNIQAIGDW
jgi:hypothetical protein